MKNLLPGLIVSGHGDEGIKEIESRQYSFTRTDPIGVRENSNPAGHADWRADVGFHYLGDYEFDEAKQDQP